MASLRAIPLTRVVQKPVILVRCRPFIATPLHQPQHRLQRQTGLGLILSLPQTLNHVKVGAGIGTFRIALVIRIQQTQRAAVPAARRTTYRWMVVVVVAPMTIVRFPMVVLQERSTVEEAAAVFQRRF